MLDIVVHGNARVLLNSQLGMAETDVYLQENVADYDFTELISVETFSERSTSWLSRTYEYTL